jgi:hypothetical protein
VVAAKADGIAATPSVSSVWIGRDSLRCVMRRMHPLLGFLALVSGAVAGAIGFVSYCV